MHNNKTKFITVIIITIIIFTKCEFINILYKENYQDRLFKILFVSEIDSVKQIAQMNSDGSELVMLTNNGSWNIHPIWSPDGNKIVFRSGKDRGNNIYSMLSDSSTIIRLSYGLGVTENPNWSFDSNYIVFDAGNSGVTREIFTIKYDGTDLKQLTNNNIPDEYPLWSHANNKILFLRSTA